MNMNIPIWSSLMVKQQTIYLKKCLRMKPDLQVGEPEASSWPFVCFHLPSRISHFAVKIKKSQTYYFISYMTVSEYLYYNLKFTSLNFLV